MTICGAGPGIDVDGQPFGSVIQDGLHQSFMFILSDHSREFRRGDPRQIKGPTFNRFMITCPPGGRLQVYIRGANHFSVQ